MISSKKISKKSLRYQESKTNTLSYNQGEKFVLDSKIEPFQIVRKQKKTNIISTTFFTIEAQTSSIVLT